MWGILPQDFRVFSVFRGFLKIYGEFARDSKILNVSHTKKGQSECAYPKDPSNFKCSQLSLFSFVLKTLPSKIFSLCDLSVLCGSYFIFFVKNSVLSVSPW